MMTPAVYEERPGLFTTEVRVSGVRYRKRSSDRKLLARWGALTRLLGHPPTDGEFAAERSSPPRHPLRNVAREARSSRAEWKASRDPSLDQRLETIVTWFGPVADCDTFTTARVYEFVRHLEATHTGRQGGKLSPKTINRYLAVISGLLDYARHCRYTTSNPELPWAAETKGQRPIVADDAELLILTRLAPPHALILRVLLSTPIRPGREFYELPVEAIEERWLRLPRSKNGHERNVPIDPALSRPLRALFAGPERPTRDAFYRAFKDACAAAGLSPALTPYSLRHTVGTRLARKVPGKLVQHLMGHRDPRTTDWYIHFNDEDMQQAAAVLRPGLQAVRSAQR